MNNERMQRLYERFRTLAGEQQELIKAVHAIMYEMLSADPRVRGGRIRGAKQRALTEARLRAAYPTIHALLLEHRHRSATWIAREVEQKTGISWRRVLPFVRGVRGWWAPRRRG
jgi:hypothetical protein